MDTEEAQPYNTRDAETESSLGIPLRDRIAHHLVSFGPQQPPRVDQESLKSQACHQKPISDPLHSLVASVNGDSCPPSDLAHHSTLSYRTLLEARLQHEVDDIFFGVIDYEVFDAIIMSLLPESNELPPCLAEDPPSPTAPGSPAELGETAESLLVPESPRLETGLCLPADFGSFLHLSSANHISEELTSRPELADSDGAPELASEKIGGGGPSLLSDCGQPAASERYQRTAIIEELPEDPGPYDDMPIWQREVTESKVFAGAPFYEFLQAES